MKTVTRVKRQAKRAASKPDPKAAAAASVARLDAVRLATVPGLKAPIDHQLLRQAARTVVEADYAAAQGVSDQELLARELRELMGDMDDITEMVIDYAPVESASEADLENFRDVLCTVKKVQRQMRGMIRRYGIEPGAESEAAE